MLLSLPRSAKAAIGLGLVLASLLALHLLGTLPAAIRWTIYRGDQKEPSKGTYFATPHGPATSQDPNASDSLPCQGLAGSEDVLVVMRTGATEIRDKLTVHVDTTFKCYPNLVVFSDYEEVFHDIKVHDVLANIDDEIKTNNPDFAHYQHVLEKGRKGLNESELSGAVSEEEGGGVGKNYNAGWRLDKWKFLPMINATLALHPDKAWYVFVEPDTYLVWSNLLQWLPNLDPTEPYYFGSEVMIGDDLFAHGGSAFLLSRPAMEKAAETYRSKLTEWHAFTANHWAGDCILGRALHDSGVELTWAWPQFQGGNPASMDWSHEKGLDRVLWCNPALSYHHLIPFEIANMFLFEQQWIKSTYGQSRRRGLFRGKGSDSVLHHRDVFKQYVLPKMSSRQQNWNNTADTQVTQLPKITILPGPLLEQCASLCEANTTCIQYAAGPLGCYSGSEVRMGQPEGGVASGWMVERVEKWMDGLDHCLTETGWIIP